MDTSLIRVLPITGSIGAEIEGVDLSQPLTDECFAEIRAAIVEHLVLFFRDQEPSLAQQVAFTRRFGPRAATPFIGTMAENPDVIEIIKEANEKSRFVFGGGWHSDFSFQKQPPYVTCLRAAEVPEYGGDTLYANMIQAYETLPEPLRERVDGMTALHSGERAYSPKMQNMQDLLENMTVHNTEEAEVLQAHPLVRVHPESGRRGLFISPVYTVGIEGMANDEATAFLDGLNKHALHEANTCRFRWRKNSIAIWDNRFTQHYALNDYAGKRRHMYRTTAEGEIPVGIGAAEMG
jgi:taurine dioxygenase